MSICLSALYILHVTRSAVQGMGNTVLPMVSGIVEFCLRVGLAFLVGWTGYQNGIFGAEVSAWFGAAIFLAFSYLHGIRKLMKSE